uniref:PA domain-containing protein n=1 Tax=Globisporangium ultimum (strain ATCC 200006 / CBS 805.95 / DAOM BR144) TaxID=431595 RepID=K3XA26_GLOUD
MKRGVLALSASWLTLVYGAQQEALLVEPAATMAASMATAPVPSSPAFAENEQVVQEEEPFWGRVYLRHGVAPIQYFRDSFGGPMVNREVEFVFPKHDDQGKANNFGCEPLQPEEESAISSAAAANQSIVLVVDRGECTFETKSRNAEAAGAVGLVVISADESATRPVATVSIGEITIPSVMIRKSGGDLLHAIAAHERVFGLLAPIVCTKKAHYMCSPRTATEREYISERSTHSGVIVSSDGKRTRVGEFLAATYGSILPGNPAMPVSKLLHASVVCQAPGAQTETMPRLDGKLALVARSTGDCSVFEIVSRAQLSGAIAALVVADSSKAASMRPSVEADWYGYNITIFAGIVSEPTAMQLIELHEENEVPRVHFELDNNIADAWEEIHKVSVRSAWPRRKERKDTFLKQILMSYTLNEDQLLALKDHFLTVGGGTIKSWETLVPPVERTEMPMHDDQKDATTAGASVADQLIASTSASHEEL